MADDNEFVPGEGDIEIELEGRKFWLKPTLEACLRISRANGSLGPRELSERCLQLNFDSIVYVIAAGLGCEIDEKLERSVYRTGIVHLFGKCVRFIHIISNGGRPFVEGEEAKGKADPTTTA